jgi:hypothetical protein
VAEKLLNLVSDTGATVYAIIAREIDMELLNDADGAFAAAPADPYLALAEHATVKGLYQVSESRTPWDDGRYLMVYYAQLSGSPTPASDIVLGGGIMQVMDDAEISLGSLNISESLSAVAALGGRFKEASSDMKQVMMQLRLLTTAVEKRTALKI